MTDLTRVNELQDKILSAIGIVNGQLLSSLSYDKTVTCIIKDDSKRKDGVYEVSDGELIFDAYSASTDYRLGNTVYVTIPNGDYNNQKIIIGKKVSEQEKMVEIKKPFDTFFSMTDDLVTEDEEYSFSTVANSNQGKTFQSILRLENPDIINYTRVGIKAKFKSYLKDCVSGNYGLCLVLELEPDEQNKDINPVLYLDSSNMIGNPYNFETYYEQEAVFDISDYSDKIKNIELKFYHTGDFKNRDNEPITDSMIDNLFVKDIELHFGYDTSMFVKDLVEVYSLDDLIYTTTDEDLTREIKIRWAHINDDGEPVNMKNFPDVDFEIRFYRYRVGAVAADPYCGVYWEKLIDTQNNINSTWEFQLDGSLQQNKIKVIIIKDNIPYYSNELIFNNKEEVINPDGIYHILNALIIKADDETNGNYLVYGQDRQIIDTGYNKQIRTLSAWFDSNNDGEIGTNEQIQYTNNSNDNQVTWYFPTENTMLKLNNGNNYEQIELRPYEENRYYFINSDGNYEKSTEKTMNETIKYYEINNDGYYELVTNFYKPNIYYIQEYKNCENIPYDQTETYYQHEGTYIRIFNVSLLEYEKNKQNLYILTYSLDNKGYNGDKEYYTYKSTGIVRNDTPKYTIESFYSPNKTNNVVKCEYTLNNVTYIASKEFTFGTFGTMGTDQTLIIDYVKNNQHSVLVTDNPNTLSEAKFQVQLYNSQNQLQNIPDGEVTWSWYYNDDIRYYYRIVDKNGEVLKIGEPYKEKTIDKIKEEEPDLLPEGTTNVLEYNLETKFPYDITITNTINQNISRNSVLNLTNYNFQINSLYILQATVGELTTYFPIALTSSNDYKYLTGPTQVIYSSDGKIYYNNESYKLYDIGGQEVVENINWKILSTKPTNVYNSIGFLTKKQFNQLKLGDNLYYKTTNNEFILVSETNNNWDNYSEKINYYQLIEDQYYGYLNSNNTLVPWGMYIEDAPIYGIQCFSKNGNDDNKTVLWTQPILVLQNRWFSNVINKWNGETLVLNAEEGIINTKAFSAGKKNSDNTFSGVLIGDWTNTNSDQGITNQTGIYGIHDGVISYALTEDGNAWFGKSGRGKIELNGDNTTISSSLWKEQEKGMQINLGNLTESPSLILKSTSLDPTGQLADNTEKILELGFSKYYDRVDEGQGIKEESIIEFENGESIIVEGPIYEEEVPDYIPYITKKSKRLIEIEGEENEEVDINVVEHIMRNGDEIYLNYPQSYDIVPIDGLSSSKLQIEEDELNDEILRDDYWTIDCDKTLYVQNIRMEKVDYPAFNQGQFDENKKFILTNEEENNTIQNTNLPLMQLSNVFVTRDDNYDEIISNKEPLTGEISTADNLTLLTKDIFYRHPFCLEDEERNLCFPDLSNTSMRFFYHNGREDWELDDKYENNFTFYRHFYKNVNLVNVPKGDGWWGKPTESFSTYKLTGQNISSSYYEKKDKQHKSQGIYDIEFEDSWELQPYYNEHELIGDYYDYISPLEDMGDAVAADIGTIQDMIQGFSYSQNLQNYDIYKITNEKNESYELLTYNPFLNFIPYNFALKMLSEAQYILDETYWTVRGRYRDLSGETMDQNIIACYDQVNQTFYDLFISAKDKNGNYIIGEEELETYVNIPDNYEFLIFINEIPEPTNINSTKELSKKDYYAQEYWIQKRAQNYKLLNKYALLYARETGISYHPIEYALGRADFGSDDTKKGRVIYSVKILKQLNNAEGFYWGYIDECIKGTYLKFEGQDLEFEEGNINPAIQLGINRIIKKFKKDHDSDLNSSSNNPEQLKDEKEVETVYGYWYCYSTEEAIKYYKVHNRLTFDKDADWFRPNERPILYPFGYNRYVLDENGNKISSLFKYLSFTSDGMKKLTEVGDFQPNTYYIKPKNTQDYCVNLIYKTKYKYEEIGRINSSSFNTGIYYKKNTNNEFELATSYSSSTIYFTREVDQGYLYYNGQQLKGEVVINGVTIKPSSEENPTDYKNVFQDLVENQRAILVHNNNINFTAEIDANNKPKTWKRTITRTGIDRYRIQWEEVKEENQSEYELVKLENSNVLPFNYYGDEQVKHLFFDLYAEQTTPTYIKVENNKEVDFNNNKYYVKDTNNTDTYVPATGTYNSLGTYYTQSYYNKITTNAEIEALGGIDKCYYKLIIATDDIINYTVNFASQTNIENNLYGQSSQQLEEYFKIINQVILENSKTEEEEEVEITNLHLLEIISFINPVQSSYINNNITTQNLLDILRNYDFTGEQSIDSISTQGFEFAEEEGKIYFNFPNISFGGKTQYDFKITQDNKTYDINIAPPREKKIFTFLGKINSDNIIYYKKQLFDKDTPYSRNKFFIYDIKENKYILSTTFSPLDNRQYYKLISYSEDPDAVESSSNPYIHLSLNGPTDINDKFNYPFLIQDALSVDWFGNAEFKGTIKAKSGWIGNEKSHFDIKTKDDITYLSYKQNNYEGDKDTNRMGDVGFYLSPEEGLGMGHGRVQIAANGLHSRFGAMHIRYFYPHEYSQNIQSHEDDTRIVTVEGATSLTVGENQALIIGGAVADGSDKPKILPGLILYTPNSLSDTITAYRYGSWKSLSDISVKKNIETPSSSALSAINRIKVESYDWKDSEKHVEMGLVAQHLEEVLPELVSQNKFDGLKGIDYEGLIPYCIKAIQELNAEIKELKGEKGETK